MPEDRWASPLLAAHAAYLRSLRTTRCAEVLEFEGVYAVRTGCGSNSENGVVSAGDARASRAVAQDLVAWFAECGVPASWLCAEGPAQQQWTDVLQAAGCQAEHGGWEMYAQLAVLDLDARSVSQHVRIMPVASEADLEGWLDVASACAWFETPRERDAFKRLGLELALSASHQFYVASSGETALGMASAFYTGELALLTSIAVLPAARRQGIARALALSRLRTACERGCRSAVLAPSADGAGLYRALGFEAHRQPPDRWFYLPFSTTAKDGERSLHG
jgi:GNAT superfamily N-acetyltransferase